MQHDSTNRGALFKNQKKNGERDPDYTGTINVAGREMWINGWINTSKNGDKYMSLSVKPKNADKGKANKAAQAADTFGIG